MPLLATNILRVLFCIACFAPALALGARAQNSVQLLPHSESAAAEAVTSGAMDSRFVQFDLGAARDAANVFWVRYQAPNSAEVVNGAATVNVHKGRHMQVQPYMQVNGQAQALRLASTLPKFAGAHEAIFLLPEHASLTQPIYARIEVVGSGAEQLAFSISSLPATLALGSERARMIALTFGALIAMALAAFLIWFVLSEKLVMLYGLLFSMQALYVAYLSGHGFEWPLFSLAAPLMSYAWNVPAALTGAFASLFVREIAELKHFSPRVYRLFGWLAVVFCVLAFANLAQHVGLGDVVVTLGNLIFLSTAIFTLVVAFLAWRRKNRAAGWFLIAWGLLEAFTIAAAAGLLVSDPESTAGVLYYGLPLSMVAAAVLIALGVADRLRDQRIALTDAERRAQTDSLTGVLNRRSLLERLDGACARAQARGLPLGLLFIDLDHFKQINDTYGHAAGDACLKAIIEPIQAELRQSDVIGRYGGEEFVVILSSADASAAEPIAERIRTRVADVRVEGYGPVIHVTCSIGVATSDMLGVWGEKLIARADEAVYAAKRSGRNRVQLAAPPLAA